MEVWGAQHLLLVLSARQNQVLGALLISGGNLWSLCNPFHCFLFFTNTTHGNKKPLRLNNTDTQQQPLNTYLILKRFARALFCLERITSPIFVIPIEISSENIKAVCYGSSHEVEYQAAGSHGSKFHPVKLSSPTPCNYPRRDTASARRCAPTAQQGSTENNENVITIFLKSSGDLSFVTVIVNKEIVKYLRYDWQENTY